MEKYFTPEIIVALITGIISLLTFLIKYNIDSKLSRITDERTKWRDSMREVAEKLVKETLPKSDKQNLPVILTELKMRLNSYGKWKNNFLEDSHIWKCISKIETSEQSEDTLKSNIIKLIDYISLLLKFDWERSKLESSMNYLSLTGYIVYIISNALFAYFAFADFQDATIYLVLVLIVVFACIFFMPSYLLSIFKLTELPAYFSNLLLSYGIPIFILVSLIYKSTKNPDKYGLGSLDLPIFLMVVALVLLAVSQIEKFKNITNYKNALKKLDFGSKLMLQKSELKDKKKITKRSLNKKGNKIVMTPEAKQKKNRIKKQGDDNFYKPFRWLKLIFVALGKRIKFCYYRTILPIQKKMELSIQKTDKKMEQLITK